MGDWPEAAIAATISRCGYSAAAGGTFEPWIPAAMFLPMKDAFGSVEPDGGCTASRSPWAQACALSRGRRQAVGWSGLVGRRGAQAASA